jgi:hypothetical protein
MSARRGGAILLLALASCGTNATIREGGVEHHVRIDRSTPSALIVQTNDGEMTIPRAGITEIDHPGNVLAVAGLPFIALGVANLLGAWSCGDGESSHTFCMGRAGGGLTLSVGLLMTVWGANVWDRSHRAATPVPDSP